MTGTKYKGYVLRWIYPAVGKPFVVAHDPNFDNECVFSAESMASAKRIIRLMLTEEI